jgi:hypothetical protein
MQLLFIFLAASGTADTLAAHYTCHNWITPTAAPNKLNACCNHLTSSALLPSATADTTMAWPVPLATAWKRRQLRASAVGMSTLQAEETVTPMRWRGRQLYSHILVCL